MPSGPGGWNLDLFAEAFDSWIDTETKAGQAPDDDLRLIVLGWVMSRATDPYLGARRDGSVPNLWFARLPGAYVGKDRVVCAYFIHERIHSVRCTTIATLSDPI